MMKSKNAFTLAEVLITLGIIGVVATLTLPNVMANYAKKSQVAQLQRSVNAVSSAMGNYLLDKKTDNFADTNFAADPSEFFTDYLGGTYLGTYWGTAMNDVFKKNYKKVSNPSTEYTFDQVVSNSSGYGFFDKDYACGKLVTGATVCMSKYPNYDWTGGNYVAAIDVNSDAGPNIIGRDLFMMDFTKKGRVTVQSGWTYGYEYCHQGSEYACFTKIMLDGWEMNY